MNEAPRSFWQRFKRNPTALVGAGMLVLLSVAMLAAGTLEQQLSVSGVDADLFNRFGLPDGQHWLGADTVGRDELARLLRGGQTSLLIGLLAAGGTTVIGTIIGAVSGYVGGRIDALVMRVTDFAIAVPHLPILIILAALDLGKLGFSQDFIRSGSAAVWRIVAILVVLGWTGVARLVRAGTMMLARREFVEAARACGATPWRIVFVHILPNTLAPIIVYATTSMGRAILAESGLSFLGLGIQSPLTSWGSMLNDAQATIGTAPRLAILPGLLIFLTVVAVNSLGEGLQSALNPRAGTEAR